MFYSVQVPAMNQNGLSLAQCHVTKLQFSFFTESESKSNPKAISEKKRRARGKKGGKERERKAGKERRREGGMEREKET